MKTDPEPSDTATRAMPRRVRGQSLPYLARSVICQIRTHPSNRDAPNRAVLRACSWQVRKRLTRGPIRRRAFGLDLLFPASCGSLSNLMYFGEYFEWENINFIRRYLRPGDAVIDAGANVGMFTYAIAQITAPDGRIHVFEPMAWAADVISANVARNDLANRVTVNQMAVADRTGTANFASDLDVSSHIELVPGTSASKLSVEVPTTALDDSVPAGPIALAKIDVEGAETLALTGFREHLRNGNPPAIIIEARKGLAEQMGSSRTGVLGVLHDFGYETFLFNVETSGLVPVPPDSNEDVIAVHGDSVAMVQDRIARP